MIGSTVILAAACVGSRVFLPLGPGEVKPRGWLRDRAEAMANGYTGHAGEYHADFALPWTAAFKEPRPAPHCWPYECGAYWLDGLVRLAYQLDDPGLTALAKARVEPVLSGIGENSILFYTCMSRTNAVDCANFAGEPFFIRAAGQYARGLWAYYLATKDERVLRAFRLAYGGGPGELNGVLSIKGVSSIMDAYAEGCRTYGEAGFAPLAGMFDALFDSRQARRSDWPWHDYLEFPASGTVSFLSGRQEGRGGWARWHGVMACETLGSLAMGTVWTGDRRFLEKSIAWYDLIHGACGQVHGAAVCDEQFARRSAYRGTETCTVSGELWDDMIFLSLSGDARFADAAERVAFNAGPVCTSRDGTRHVYFQAPNRVLAADCGRFEEGPKNAGGEYRREHFPRCCMASLNRILPIHLQHLWMKRENGLAAVMYGPNTLETTLSGAGRVEIESETDYPFGETIRMKIAVERQAAFPVWVRLPNWCRSPKVLVNGTSLESLTPEKGFARIDRTWRTGDEVSLVFPQGVSVERGVDAEAGNAPFAAVTLGPLTMALPLEGADENTHSPGAEWQFAYDPEAFSAKVVRRPAGKGFAWGAYDSPVEVFAELRGARWRHDRENPSLPKSVAAGGRRTVRLVPYGSARMRVSMFPVCHGADVEERVEDVLGRLTIEQKIGQTWQCLGKEITVQASDDMSGVKLKPLFLDEIRAGRYGSVIGKRGLENYNAIQRAAMEGVGIPLLVGHDMIHSVATCYPVPLALACSWDESLWERVASAMAAESLLQGCNWTFTPMLDVALDARWGRISEGGGCDPLLAGLMGAAMIRGFQGEDMADGLHIAACAKHFVCYGASLGGRDYNAVELSDDTLRNTYLPPFRMAVDAGVATVMPAFHSYNGVPCSMNSYLLRDLLRGEMGFDGATISDWEAVKELLKHGTAADEADAAARALSAGMDMEMVSTCYPDNLAKLVEEGRVDVKTLDDAVRNILRVKFRLGLFDHPEIDGAKVSAAVDSAANRALAREAARKSIVLLKNSRETLPLKPRAKVALLGDVAASDWQMLGCWSTKDLANFENATLLDGLKADGVDVEYTHAYTLTGRVDLAAVEMAAAKADVVIAAFGNYWEKSGEGASLSVLELPEGQLAAARAVKAAGKPLVAVVFGGRPLALRRLAELADALVMAWSPGGCGGWGIADVLTGSAEPWGRLTVDIPRTTGTCPVFYSRTTTGRPAVVDKDHPFGGRCQSCYVDVEPGALYPFGFGLTYTRFEMGNEECRIVNGAGGAQLAASVDVTNVGRRSGSELVQLYVRDEVAKIARPRRELKGFSRVELAPGETKRVVIKVPVESLGYFVNGRYVVEPGGFTAWLASDSDGGRPVEFDVK